LVLTGDQVKMLPVSQTQSTVSKLVDLVPEIVDSVKNFDKSKDKAL
jgi:uncharacterized spore protein YtfJ